MAANDQPMVEDTVFADFLGNPVTIAPPDTTSLQKLEEYRGRGMIEETGVSTENTAALVDRAASGDQHAFGILVTRYAALVTGVAWSVCGDFGRSEDVGQDAFLEAWKTLSTLRDPDKFVAWVCTIARRRAIDAIRGDRTSSAACSIDQVPGEFHDRRQLSPETNMAQQQERDRVWSMLEGLPSQYRESMVLFYRGEQSTRDVAIALDQNEATIRQRLKRGREMLREEMTESIRRTLCETAPKAAFTAVVLAGLPSATGATVATATTAAVAGKSAGTGTLSITSAAGGAVFGSLFGLLGGALGTWMSWKNCEYESQQKFILRQTRNFLVSVAIFMALLPALIYARTHGFIDNNVLYGSLLVGLILGFQGVNIVWMWRGIRGYRQLAEQARVNGEPMREPARQRMEIMRQQTRTIHSDGTVCYEAFRWNAGAWIGICFGSLAWLLPLSAVAFWNGSAAAGTIVSLCCLLGSVVAVAMWRARQQRSAYAAIQIWCGVAGVLTAIVLATLQFLTDQSTQTLIGWQPWAWCLLLLFPLLSFHFHNIRRSFDRNMQIQDQAGFPDK